MVGQGGVASQKELINSALSFRGKNNGSTGLASAKMAAVKEIDNEDRETYWHTINTPTKR